MSGVSCEFCGELVPLLNVFGECKDCTRRRTDTPGRPAPPPASEASDKGTRIVAAAMKCERTGMIYFHERPARHHSVLWSRSELGEKSHGLTQGFVTSEGRFVSREEAFIIAENAGQLIARHREGELFSEDVW